MRWCTATIRTDLDQSCTASGIYLVGEDKDQTEIIITISSKLGDSVKANGNRAICALDANLKRVIWENVELHTIASIDSLNSEINRYEKEFKRIPEGELYVLIFKFINPDKYRARTACAKTPFNIMSPSTPTKVTVTSSPFAASNISLFHGYVSTGIVSLVSPNVVYIDGRYLDGMEGGCVAVEESLSIGLVIGSLIKSNGEGRLLMAAPWSALAGFLPSIDLPKITTLSATTTTHDLEKLGVVVVRIRIKPNVLSWGSGVLIAKDLVVTNRHVIGKFAQDKISVQVSNVSRRIVSVQYPLDGVDLAVLKLAEPLPQHYHPAQLAKHDPVESSYVRSVGYGLFAPGRYSKALQPLQSEGIISKVVPGMLISTAGCWNGCSGGGIFNSNGDLIGIMASNARDNTAKEIMPDVSMSIPVSILRQALTTLPKDTDPTSSTGFNSEEVRKLWKLDRTHKDISSSIKAKL